MGYTMAAMPKTAPNLKQYCANTACCQRKTSAMLCLNSRCGKTTICSKLEKKTRLMTRQHLSSRKTETAPTSPAHPVSIDPCWISLTPIVTLITVVLLEAKVEPKHHQR